MRLPLSAILTLLLLVAVSAYGQGSRISTPPAKRKGDLQDAAEQLKQAKDKIDLSKAGKAADKLPGNLGEAAKSALESTDSKDDALNALRSAAGSLLPQAQKLMRGGDAASAPNPADAEAARKADAPPGPVGPQPLPLMPLVDLPKAARGKANISIDSDDAVFDLKQGIFIYTGHVRARHPQFYIECEQLEVHMVMENEDAPPKAAPKSDPILANKEEKQNGIKKAIASGPMVTIQKMSEQGEAQEAKCRKAVYEASTGEITMTDYPQVLRGNVIQVATSPSTTMVFNQKGKLTTNGPSKTDIMSSSESPLGAPGTAPAPNLRSKGQQ